MQDRFIFIGALIAFLLLFSLYRKIKSYFTKNKNFVDVNEKIIRCPECNSEITPKLKKLAKRLHGTGIIKTVYKCDCGVNSIWDTSGYPFFLIDFKRVKEIKKKSEEESETA